MTESTDIGVFGGTFDPIHLGHLVAAEEVRVKLDLDRILFVPAGRPWLKVDRPVSPAKHRLEMIRLAIADRPQFALSTVEVDRPGPSYTVETLELLRRQLGAEARIFFLLGSDGLPDLPEWREPRRLIQLCRLAVFARPGRPVPSLESLETAIPGLSENVVFVEVPQVDVSATQIRRQVAEGVSVRDWLPPMVEDYILTHGLYRER